MPFWSDDSTTIAAINIFDGSFQQFVLGATAAAQFAPAANSIWGRTFSPDTSSGTSYAHLTNFSTGTFEIVAPNVPLGTRGLGIKVECPECGLSLFGVARSGSWTNADVRDIYAGVSYTGEALALQFGGWQGVDAFRRILLQNNPAITFERDNITAGFSCNASNDPTITCLKDNQTTEYTVVHELGHIFTRRTGFTALPPLPTLPSTPGTPAYGYSTFYGGVRFGVLDAEQGIVMGLFPNQYGDRFPDIIGFNWVRGDRGWGTAANLENAAIPCVFQQNPLDVNDIDAAQVSLAPPELVTETDEAAADMFLNWVYSRLTTGETFGFKNRDYRGLDGQCANAGVYQATALPGNARFQLVNERIMPTVATYFPTITPTP